MIIARNIEQHDPTHQQVVDLLCHYHHQEMLKSCPVVSSELFGMCLLSRKFADIDDRLDTFREAMLWVLNRLAPDRDIPRPGEIPSWNDSIWSHRKWRIYLLLRYLYFEPLPHDQFLPDQQRPGTLMRIFQISKRHEFYSLKHQATDRFRHLLISEIRNPKTCKQIKLNQVRKRLKRAQKQPEAFLILQIASTFFRAFSLEMLEQILSQFDIDFCADQINTLVYHRCFIRLPQANQYLVPDLIRQKLQSSMGIERRQQAHAIAAELCNKMNQLPDQIRHSQRAGKYHIACKLIESNWGTISSRCGFQETQELLQGFRAHEMITANWMQVLLMQGSHLIRFGMLEDARERFSRYLHRASEPGPRLLATIFLAHICSNLDHHEARFYYASGAKSLNQHPEYAQFFYSSKGRFHLSVGEYAQAEEDLLKAASVSEHPTLTFRSVMLFAMTDLYLINGKYQEALRRCQQLFEHCQREKDEHLKALAAGVLGKIYLKMECYSIARRWFEKSIAFHSSRNNSSEISKTLRYLAIIHVQMNELDQAIQVYNEALEFAVKTPQASRNQTLIHIELAKLLIESDQYQTARQHWLRGYQIAQALNLEDSMFQQLKLLQEKLPGLDISLEQIDRPPLPDLPLVKKALQMAHANQTLTSTSLAQASGTCRSTAFYILDMMLRAGLLTRHGKARATRYTTGNPGSTSSSAPSAVSNLHPDLRKILEFIRDMGQTNSGVLVQMFNVSRATAKRHLSELVRLGFLKRHGRGRSTGYVLNY